MQKIITLVLVGMATVTSLSSHAEEITVEVAGNKASEIIENFTYGPQFSPAYHHLSEIYCSAKHPKGTRSWGYASCTNNSWFDNGTKSAYFFTLALINALPEELQERLVVSSADRQNAYSQAITVSFLICDEARSTHDWDTCVIGIDL